MTAVHKHRSCSKRNVFWINSRIKVSSDHLFLRRDKLLFVLLCVPLWVSSRTISCPAISCSSRYDQPQTESDQPQKPPLWITNAAFLNACCKGDSHRPFAPRRSSFFYAVDALGFISSHNAHIKLATDHSG